MKTFMQIYDKNLLKIFTNLHIKITILIHKKTSFKGKILTSKAFAVEPEIIEKIKNLPKNIFLEHTDFLKFCKSIDITPKISRAITKRLAEVRQTNVNSKSFIA